MRLLFGFKCQERHSGLIFALFPIFRHVRFHISKSGKRATKMERIEWRAAFSSEF